MKVGDVFHRWRLIAPVVSWAERENACVCQVYFWIINHVTCRRRLGVRSEHVLDCIANVMKKCIVNFCFLYFCLCPLSFFLSIASFPFLFQAFANFQKQALGCSTIAADACLKDTKKLKFHKKHKIKLFQILHCIHGGCLTRLTVVGWFLQWS